MSQRRIAYLQRRYGISQADAVDRLQATHCDICGQPFSDTKRMNVDHNHATGETRGCLCSFCNRTVIGSIEAAARYCEVEVRQYALSVVDYLWKHS